jgi:SAM-dependent methyltransferase
MKTIQDECKELFNYYDTVLNKDKTTYKSSNDEPTPIDCITEMLDKVPEELWARKDLKILDPCCGNGNFHVPIYYKLKDTYNISSKNIINNILYFNDINIDRLQNVEKIFTIKNEYPNMTSLDFLEEFDTIMKYDLIVANPPYAKLLANGKRASKNHNLIKDFLNKSLSLLKKNGYLMFITPDNWMSYADRNTIIELITSLQIIHLDIHSAKKYFKKIGSSFTWYIIQNCKSYKPINISGIWKKNIYQDQVDSGVRKYIPLLYNSTVKSILSKTVDNTALNKFQVETSSDLHKYTKRDIISTDKDDEFKYRLIHTPSQTVYASRPHKYQEGYKVFISTTNTYSVFVDDCGMTQSIAFIRCKTQQDAMELKNILEHPLYIFINNICRWGNFNNIRILQSFPVPKDSNNIYESFGITDKEQKYIEKNL